MNKIAMVNRLEGHEQTLLALAGLGSVALLMRDTVMDIVHTWYTSNAYNHGFLIIPICLYLVWRQRAELPTVPARPEPWGILVVAFVSLVWLVGHITGTLLIQELALIAAIQGIILTMFGFPLCRKFIFPLAYLYFAVPFGQDLEPRLQAVTAKLAVEMLRVVGVPVFSDGNLISIPTGNFDVAEECSGLRFLIASIAIGTLFAGIIYHSWLRRAGFIAMTIVLPIVANGARAFGIILLAYLTTNELATGIDHIVYGWIFFTFILFVMLAVGMRFREPDNFRTIPTGDLAHLAAAAPARSILIAGLLALAPLAAAKLYGSHLDEVPVIGSVQLRSPSPQAPWREDVRLEDPVQPTYVGADSELHIGFTTGVAHAYLDIGYFLRDRRGAQAVSSDHRFEGKNGWVLAAQGTTTAMIDGQSLSVQFVRSVRGGEGHLVWYWYWIDGRFTANPYVAKLLETKVKLLGGEHASAVIAIGADYDRGSADAEKVLREFALALPGLRAALDQAPQF